MQKLLRFVFFSALLFCACVSGGKAQYGIVFDPSAYEERTFSAGEKSVRYRAYENIVYVKNPVDTDYQIMNIYIPSAYFSGGQVAGYNERTAPIFFPNAVGGYMPGKPARIGTRNEEGVETVNASAYALLQGFVVASPGARGRTSDVGRAPSCIVDLKAAVRYLRYNDRIMPGDAEKSFRTVRVPEVLFRLCSAQAPTAAITSRICARSAPLANGTTSLPFQHIAR